MPRTHLRYVTTRFMSTDFKYLFYSRLRLSKHREFGQEEITSSTPVTNIIMGVNNFKPAKAKILESYDAGWISSFCSDDKIPLLNKAGYSISMKKTAVYQSSRISGVYFVRYNNVCLAWQRSRVPEEIEMRDIDVTEASSESELIFGASFPKPPTVTKLLSNGRRFQTFCGPGAFDSSGLLKPSLLKEGWMILRRGCYTKFHLGNKFSIHH